MVCVNEAFCKTIKIKRCAENRFQKGVRKQQGWLSLSQKTQYFFINLQTPQIHICASL